MHGVGACQSVQRPRAALWQLGHVLFGQIVVTGTARQRIIGTLIETADALRIEPLLVHFQIRSRQRLRRQYLDCKADGLGSPVEAAIFECLAARSYVAGRKQLCLAIVIEFIHRSGPDFGRAVESRPQSFNKERRAAPAVGMCAPSMSLYKDQKAGKRGWRLVFAWWLEGRGGP